MADYTRVFAISASGLSLERLRLEVAATNFANAHATSGANGRPFTPLRVVARAADAGFEAKLTGTGTVPPLLQGVGDVEVRSVQAGPRLEYDPGNPAADDRGFVSLSPVNPVEEMLTVLSSVRAFQANVRVLNAAKSMALKALEIGDSRSS
ncbi:MAG: flagellar basal body rod protein FlgC [Nevskia sp.]|jgi:flagellar basal-body rod protein FlgC|nr:flagellar basal body rod protein FlgC [Nevskia sp.]